MFSKIKFTALFAVLVMALAGAAVFMADSNETEAIGEDLSGTYGTPTNINIAPGYRWTYTPDFPSDLTQYLTVSLQVNDSNVGSVSGKTVTVNIPTNASTGTKYNVVIKATMTSPVTQTAYQYVTFTVVSGLSVSGTINDIIKGSNINFTPTGTSGMGTVTWAVQSGKTLPAGLSLTNGVVSGTPTALGAQTVYLTATAPGGETKNLEVSFTVYSKIVGGAAQTITSYNSNVSSTAITNGEDIGVTWAVTSGTLPAGFTLNSSTGVVSGKSAAVQSTTVTITGTSSHGPSQTATKQITIQSEPSLTLSCSGSILTYKNNSAEKSVSMTSSDSSPKTWTITDFSGASISNGTLKVKNSTAVGMNQKITVTCQTAYGQTRVCDVTVSVEDTLAITGDSVLNIIAGATGGNTSAFTVTGGSGNTLAASTEATGLNVSIVNGQLHAQKSAIGTGAEVTVTVTSAAGQTASTTVTVNAYSQLIFTSAPTGGAIIYAV
ncbi:cell surface protein [methanogenic archaeon mixed culture ISO4-G1]|nr:cell surface protein [methanogenic archaeon mixed culture ISO4-G1]